MKHEITIAIDEHQLAQQSDESLATLWYVAQANPAPFGDPAACHLVEQIGREIICRWLRITPAPLWNWQGSHVQHASFHAARENAARYLKLRDVPVNQLGAAGVPCIAVPSGLQSGDYVSGEEADAAVDSITIPAEHGRQQ